jgi:predicted RNA-binding protein YlqC (UPF0109 family)
MFFNGRYFHCKGTESMKDLLVRIAQELVDDPEQVQVTEIETAQTTVLELKVAKSDVGKIIGKHGKTANAIRVVLNAASGKARKRYLLEIVD